MWDCKYHVVIVPKYRKKLMYGKLRNQVGPILKELCRQKGVEVVEGHVMPDHVHLLLTPQKTISHVMNLIKGGFSHRLASSFPVWQRGFADHLVLDQDHFESRRAYIHQNPVRAGLVSAPELYRYSSAYKPGSEKIGSA